MKNVLVSFLILTSAATSFATFVDRTQTCTTTTKDFKLDYKGNYRQSGTYTLTKASSGAEINLFGKNEGGDEPDSNMFEVAMETIYSQKTTPADCSEEGLAFAETETKSRAALKFTQLSAEAQQAMGMTSLQTRIFNCTTVVSSPVNCFGGQAVRN